MTWEEEFERLTKDLLRPEPRSPEHQNVVMRTALLELRDELAAFADYARDVACECVGQRRDMWDSRGRRCVT